MRLYQVGSLPVQRALACFGCRRKECRCLQAQSFVLSSYIYNFFVKRCNTAVVGFEVHQFSQALYSAGPLLSTVASIFCWWL